MPEKDLKEGIEEFTKSAHEEEQKNRFRAAAVLYFKAIAEVCDLLLYLKIRRVPDNHTERFRLLEENFHSVYIVLHSIFGLYRKTYRTNITKNEVERIATALKRIREIEENFEKNI